MPIMAAVMRNSVLKFAPGSIRTFLGFALAGAGLASSVNLSAQNPPGEDEVFVDLGRWVILQDTSARICELRLTSERQTILRYFKRDGAPGSLRLQSRRGGFSSVFVGEIEWAFDNVRFAGSRSGQGFAPSSDNTAIEAEFRRARFLTVSQGGQQLTRLSLQTSSAGFRLLNQCAEQWRFAPQPRRTVASRPAPAPVRPAPPPPTAPAAATSAAAATQSVSQRREPRPINPGEWVRSGDFDGVSSRSSEPGRLRFTLMINEGGRVEDCVVNSSSGSRNHDQRACRVLQRRARFVPATDSAGNVVESSYSSSIRFASE